MAGVVPGQMVLDLFPDEGRPTTGPLDRCIELLVSRGCDAERVRPLAADLFSIFGSSEGFDRALCLEYFFGDRAVPKLRACPPSMLFDRGVDHGVIWDRCWAARWAPLADVFRVKRWVYNYRKPYTGAPIYIWYIDDDGREVKRPYTDRRDS